MTPKARDRYLNKLIESMDVPVIKVISGVRRCGKSTLLDIFESYLISIGIEKERIVRIDMDSKEMREQVSNWSEMYCAAEKRMKKGVRNYILLDEVQNIIDWENALISMYTDFDADFYVTGSNAVMLSPNSGTKLVGRFIEIQMLPLSFREYMDFTGSDDKEGSFIEYMGTGGFPLVALLHDRPALQKDVLSGIYSTVMDLDIIEKNDIRDTSLLKNLAEFLIENVGNTVSAKSISDYLNSGGRRSNPHTIDDYLLIMERAFLLYRVRRYDIAGKLRLKTLGKYYVVDPGFRSLIGGRQDGSGRILENIVYLELVRRGYEISIGKVGTHEVDFIADKHGDRMYVQVTKTMSDEGVAEREMRSLLEIEDNHPKMILSMDPEMPGDHLGIKNRNIIRWLLE
ncbi:MAG: ATP-binding protein [Candidatus Methanoplasma sp.]|jgi:predicted AAA+ superfamily ATPase|nr:ATP-binding protein [Candidatus Methanoplasma sp.]